MKLRHILRVMTVIGVAGVFYTYWQHNRRIGYEEVFQATREICLLVMAGDTEGLARHPSLGGKLVHVQRLLDQRDAMSKRFGFEVRRNGDGKLMENPQVITHLAHITFGHGESWILAFRFENGKARVVNSGTF